MSVPVILTAVRRQSVVHSRQERRDLQAKSTSIPSPHVPLASVPAMLL
jgi:hypothetical protein